MHKVRIPGAVKWDRKEKEVTGVYMGRKGEGGLGPTIKTGNPVPGRGGIGRAYFFKLQKKRPSSHSCHHQVGWEGQMAKDQGQELRTCTTSP